jgi:hypothetical protein
MIVSEERLGATTIQRRAERLYVRPIIYTWIEIREASRRQLE